MRPLPSKSPQEMLRSTTVAGLVLVVGSLVALGALCVKKPPTNTNVAANSNTDVNSSISNRNENTNSGEIDTSDWQTYTNEEYGFSFRYPGDWGEVSLKQTTDSDAGKKFYLLFSNDGQRFIKDGPIVPLVSLISIDYENKIGSDVPPNVDMNKINFLLTDNELKKLFLNNVVEKVTLERMSVGGKDGLRIDEEGKNMAGAYQNTKYYFPKAISNGNYHMLVVRGLVQESILKTVVSTLVFSE